MKKILSLLLVLAVLLGLAGCMPSQLPEATTEPTQTTAAVPETTEATEPSTEATIPETEPEPTQAPTRKPEPKPTKPTEPVDTRPRPTETQEPIIEETEPETQPAPQKSYTGKEEVAAYLAKHGRLPDNFITKSQAKSYGWKSGRRLEDYAPGMCIGGDRFYNKEGLLPSSGTYYECDIDTLGQKNRGAKRIVFSSDGRIYYTSDHYASFYQYMGPNEWVKV